MKYADGLRTMTETVFRGLDHNESVRDGYLYDMKNLTGDSYPVLRVRRGHTKVRTIEKPNGLFAREKLCWVDGTGFYYDGVRKGTVADSQKTFARLGSYVLIFPDKAYYNAANDTFGALEASWNGTAAFTSHVYDAEGNAEEVYYGNAITTTGTSFPFAAGQAVEISGAADGANNRTAIIRDVLEGGRKLVFTNNTFTEADGQTLTLKRNVPDMDHFCENENRLWGCKGNEIFSSALGDPFRWYNYEGLATDSYAVSVGSDGEFSGAMSFLGYAMFFKPDAIHKIYGSKPSNFQAMSSAVSGVQTGCAGSMAIAGETLYYLSRTGVVAYQGGIPSVISAPLGVTAIDEAVGGSDGRSYYISARMGDDWTMYRYDTRTGDWYKEDSVHAASFAASDGVLYYLDADDNSLYSVNTGSCRDVEWMAETGDMTDAGPDKTGVTRCRMRLATDEGTTVDICAQYDSDGEWWSIGSVSIPRKGSVILPIVPRRCDHWRLRITGKGGCMIYGLTHEYYKGGMM